jgi:predicted DNA binding CopG/RHH family protein
VPYDRPTAYPNLKLSTQTISLRLPEGLLNNIKVEANKRDMPYQRLINPLSTPYKMLACQRFQEARQL